MLKLDYNPWVPPIEDQLVLGVSHVIEYIRTETYKYLFNRHIQVKTRLELIILREKLFSGLLCILTSKWL